MTDEEKREIIANATLNDILDELDISKDEHDRELLLQELKNRGIEEC